MEGQLKSREGEKKERALVMTQTERNAAYERIRRQLGVDRIGLGPDAPPLPPRSGQAGMKPGAVLPIEAEIYGAQMYEYGEIWARPTLDLRTRCFITVAVLAALRDSDQLYRHINSALNIGITPEEIHETLLHIGVYSGLPAWENSAAVANEVLVARGTLPAGPGVTVEPKPPMTEEDRTAAMSRVAAALNLGRVGQGPEAPPLKPLREGPLEVGKTVGLQVALDMAEINGSYGFGEVWGRPGLGLRTRSFLTFPVLQVLIETEELNLHINNALNLGITQEEVYEALCHAGIYGGISGWHNATIVASSVFAQHRALGQAGANDGLAAR
jgi:4-carboxymuconolactone decarboxylase